MWNKIPILIELLNQGYDMVVWIDDDIVITELNTSIEQLFSDFIKSPTKLALSSETTHGRILNTGIICAKQGSQVILNQIFNDGVTDVNRTTPGCEQWAMHILYERHIEFRNQLMLYPPATLQGFFTPEIPDALWRKGTWSAHAAGLPTEERIQILRHHAFTNERILKKCGTISVTSKERQQHTIDHVTRIVKEKIEGDFIEIGVYKGGMVMVMLYTLMRLGELRHVHLYDTFSGMSEASENDVDMFGRKATDMWEAVKMECPLDIVKKNIESTGYPIEYIHFHVGDARQITETPECISLLRLDIDWYDIYKAVLPVFEPVTSIGGTVVIDDYIHWKGCKKAVDEYIIGKNIKIQMIDYDSCFWIKKQNNVIPPIIFQTAREPLSSDVTRLIKSKIPNGWEYKFFDDDDIIEFFKNNPDEEFPDVISLFNRIKRGQNKIDFFRAYFLYKKGGIFIDSDAMVECSFSDLTKYEFFTTESGAISGSVFNGFLGCIPGHPIMYEHVKYLYNADENAYEAYFIACYNLYTIINSKSWGDIKIFNEREIYDAFVWQSYDPVNNQIIAYHYPFTKLVPTDYLRVYQWDNKIRLGSFMDGGYVIADTVGQYDCYISCGVGSEEAFSTEFVQKYTIKESYAFDGNLTQPWRDPTPGIQFVPKNIGVTNDDKTTDLVDILSKHSDVFLKMDIEGHEFEWIKHVPTGLLNNIKQITMEFHGINDNSWDVPYKVKRECFEKLSRTHYIVHAHGNNWAQKTKHIPDVIELTFVRRDVFPTPPVWNTTKLPLKYIDRPNNPGAEDYFLSFPPFFYEPDKQVESEPRFETRKDMIKKLIPRFGVYAEVGVFKGEFTTFLQDVLCPKKLYAIDLFEGVTGSGDQDGLNFSQCQLEETRAMLEKRAITILKGDSSQMIRTLDDNSLDMIYIDANHSFEYVLRDLEASFSKVKHGGWIMGHDYGMNMKKAGHLNACEPLQRAVNNFCKIYAQNIKYKAYDGCVSFAIQVSKIAICSLSDRKPVSDVSWSIMKEYCDNHGYVFKTQRYSDPSRGSSWSKIPLLKNVLNEGFQIAVWLDDDIIITERDVRIEKLVEEFIESDKLLCVSGDNWASAYFNAGIIFAKQGAQDILQSIWDDGVCEANRFTPCMEQWGMHTLYGHNETFRKKVFIYQPHYLQSFYKNPYTDMPPAYNWKPGVWSAHVSGIVNQDERVVYMKEIAERCQSMKDNTIFLGSQSPRVAIFIEDNWAFGRIARALSKYANVDVYDWRDEVCTKKLWTEGWKYYDHIISTSVVLTLDYVPQDSLKKIIALVMHGEFGDPCFHEVDKIKKDVRYGAICKSVVEDMKLKGYQDPMWVPWGVDTDLFPLKYSVTGPIRRIGLVASDPTHDSHYGKNKGYAMFQEICDTVGAEAVYIRGKPEGQIYDDIDLLICCSRVEGGPFGIFEASASGLPVMSTPVGNMKNIDGLAIFTTVEEAVQRIKGWNDNMFSLREYTESVTREIRTNWSMKKCVERFMKGITQTHKEFDYNYMEEEERPCAARIAEWIVKTLNPKNVLDVGCGPGMYVDEILKCNVPALGIEVSDQIQKPYVRNKSLFDMTETADVVMCLEVAEHIPENKADDIVQKIISATERLLIWSAAIPGQDGIGHINCQPKEYWRDKFIQQGLEYDDECTQNCRQYISEHPPYMGWFLNNVQIFRKPTVTLTITTCKRLGSFYKTMNSLKKHCKDLCTVFVVDDSSSISDRIEMQKRYPIILITHDKKSHAHSLNIIRENIKTDYILMFEDDWVCQEDFYIWDVIKYMKQHNIDNLRFNTILMEDGLTLFNPDKLSQENALWCQQKGYILEKSETDSGVGWPGFSLNPIMIRRDVLDEPFDESIPSGYMEFDWAIRHANKKWYGKNIGGIHHIDGNDSAYVLNETHRWWDPK
jgi:glycosyltransferase involved in cell wall biosynthesis